VRRRSLVVWGLGAAALLTLVALKVRAVVVGRPLGALARSALQPIARGDLAPTFQAPDLSGRTVSLESFRGRLVVLNFWFTECAPCREEMPSLDRLARRVGGQGVEVLALSVDDEKGKVERFLAADAHLKGRNPAFRVLLDPQKLVPPRYGTYKYPETYLISGTGRILARFVGPRDWASPEAIKLVESLAR